MSRFVRIDGGWINTELIVLAKIVEPSAREYRDGYMCKYYESGADQAITTRHETLASAEAEMKFVIESKGEATP